MTSPKHKLATEIDKYVNVMQNKENLKFGTATR
jgi:hypothetical protein